MLHRLKTANRCALGYRDMQDVRRYLGAYVELEGIQATKGDGRYFDHCEAILIAAIVAYCRPFKRSNSQDMADARIKATDLQVLQVNTELASLHDLLIDRRDGAIAHADWAHHNTELLSVGEQSVTRRITYPKFTEGIDVHLFMHLANQVAGELMSIGHENDLLAQQGSENAA